MCWWVDDSLTGERRAREGQWSEAIAVGSLSFVEKVKSQLGFKATHRALILNLSADSVGIQNRKSKIDWVKLTSPFLTVKMSG